MDHSDSQVSTECRGNRALLRAALFVACVALAARWARASPTPDSRTGASRPQKLALLVGIDRYKAVNSLQGCVNDVERVKSLLIGKFGFLPENITILKDELAIRSGILDTFRTALVNRAGKDDIVVFHFSGHGSRMKDVSGDEIDGWDETIVPQDSRQPGIFDISDDEINGLLQELSKKTKNITFILDSCHSGSATRGGATIRRIPDDTRDPPPAPPYAIGTRGTESSPSHFRPASASYVLIAGCGPQELSNEYDAEGQTHGALTYFLTRALGKAGAETTYRDVMDVVRSDVSAVFPSQHPQIEGARADGYVFDVAASVAQPYLLAFPLVGKRIELQAGQVHSLTEGSLLDVYPPGTKTFGSTNRSAQIELTRVEPFRSEAQIVSGGSVARASRAVLRKRRYADSKLRLYFEGLAMSPTLLSIQRALDSCGCVEVVKSEQTAELRLSEKLGTIQTQGGDLSPMSPPVSIADAGAVKHVVDQIGQWAQWFAVLALANPVPTDSVKLMVEGANEKDEAFDGSELNVTVKNTSKRDLYVTVLDLSGDGSISVFYPQQSAEESLPPGKTLTQRVRMFVPEGRDSVKDIVKVLATSAYVNPIVFNQAAIRGAEQPRLSQDPLARFVETSALGRSRGGMPIALGGWTTAQRSVVVRRKVP